MKPLLCFCHVPKTGGTTVMSMLRANYGPRHLHTVELCRNTTKHLHDAPVFTATDWQRLFRLAPHLRAVSGHNVCLWSPPPGREVTWFTFLREPVARMASDYQYCMRHGMVATSPRDWIWSHANAACKQLSREGTALGAVEQIRRSNCWVGTTEKLDADLDRLRWQHLPDINTAYLSVNRAPDNTIAGQFTDVYYDEIVAANREDSRLYNVFKYHAPLYWSKPARRFDWGSYLAERAYTRLVVRPVAQLLPPDTFGGGQ